MEHAPERRFPLNAHDYKLYEEVGEGVSATVYRALCVPLNAIVAIKVLDLEKCNNDLDGIRREVQTMSLINHPNLLQAHCSFSTGHHLWVVMPYMAGGSCLQIMKSSYSEGFEEPIIATLLCEVLKALVYLHSHGHIHRDVKSGNILLDSNGAVKLADFGVSACMFDNGDRQRSRNTFVGTPCWMAPEVMQQLHGYDFKADIWSFGITALELAHGHAPFSKYPPMKVLLMTLQNAPPGLDYERDKRFSKSFKDMVSTCLVKDPKKRPSSEKLMKHSFFKHVKSVDFLAHTILAGLPPLGERFSRLKEKEAALLVQNKSLYENKDQLSQQEYLRGISAWNFNLEELKSQAALIQDSDEVQNVKDVEMDTKLVRHDDTEIKLSSDLSSKQDGINDIHDLKSSFYSFPSKPLDALKDCFDVGHDVNSLDSKDQLVEESSAKDVEISSNAIKRYSSGPLPPNLTSSKAIKNGDWNVLSPSKQHERPHSGPLAYRQKRDIQGDAITDGPTVQCKGRFKVTSAELAPKGFSSNSMSSMSGMSSNPLSSTMSTREAAALLPSLHSILHQNSIQRDELIKLISYVEHISGKQSEIPEKELMQESTPTVFEKELQTEIAHLEQKVTLLEEELQNQKMINAQLEKQLQNFADQTSGID